MFGAYSVEDLTRSRLHTLPPQQRLNDAVPTGGSVGECVAGLVRPLAGMCGLTSFVGARVPASTINDGAKLRNSPRRGGMLKNRRGAAALEFILVTPILIGIVIGVYDITKVLILRQQLADAAEQIAQAANKLSISSTTSATMLTASQMQNAMSTIYAAIPGLALGNGSGSYNGAYGVTLSSVVFLPLCQAANGCTPESSIHQTPYVLWSTALTEGGSQLGAAKHRACSVALTAVSQFPDDSTQLTKMIQPSGVIIPPQVVADVYYTYTPFFSWFVSAKTYWASATMPSSAGGMDQEITLNPTGSQSGVVSCTLP